MNESLSISLEPLRMGQMLDRSFRIYRSHFGKLVAIAAVSQIFAILIQGGVTTYVMTAFTGVQPGAPFALGANPFADIDPAQIVVARLLYVVMVFGLLSVNMLIQAALARGVSQSMLGEKFTAQSAFQDVLPKFGQLLLLALVYIAFMLAAFVWFLIPCVGWFTGLGMITFLGAAFAFATPILIMEERNAIDAMLRAWYLLRRRFWPTIGYTLTVGLLIGIIGGVIGGGVGLVTELLLPTVPSTGELVIVQWVQVVLTGIANTFLLPLAMVAYLLYYFDLRVRTEGFDLTLQMKTETGMPPAEVVKIVPDQSGESFITRDDLVKFFLLSLAFFAVILVIFAVFAGIGALFATTMQDPIFQDIGSSTIPEPGSLRVTREAMMTLEP